MKRRTARQKFRDAQRSARKWIRKATLHNVCPVCGADARVECGHEAADLGEIAPECN